MVKKISFFHCQKSKVDIIKMKLYQISLLISVFD